MWYILLAIITVILAIMNVSGKQREYEEKENYHENQLEE